MEIFDYLPGFCKNYYDHYKPALLGQLEIGYFWFIGVIILLFVLIFEEINYTITETKKSNSKKELINNILFKIRQNHIAEINWRRSLIVALILSFILSYFLFYPFQIPSGFMYFFLVVIIFGTIYFATAWTSSHWWSNIDYKIEDSLLKFRHYKE